MIEFPFEIKLPKDEIELEQLVYSVYNFARANTAFECSILCDQQKGFLSIGDKIREQYGIILKTEEESVKMNYKEKKSHLSRVK